MFRALADYLMTFTELIERSWQLFTGLYFVLLVWSSNPTGDIKTENVDNVNDGVLRTLTSIPSSHENFKRMNSTKTIH